MVAQSANRWAEGAWFFVRWSLVGGGVLCAGGFAARGLMKLMSKDTMAFVPFIYALLPFSIGGGIAIGLLALACWLASPKGMNWGVGLLLIGFVLFVLFIWPTPYKYYETDTRNCLMKVNRVTGDGEYIPSPLRPSASESPPSGSSAATCPR